MTRSIVAGPPVAKDRPGVLPPPAPRRGAAGGLLAAARRHWLFSGLLAAGVVLRVLTAVGYRPAIFYIDSLGTYVPAVRSLDPTGQNPIGYVLLLLKPLLAAGDFTTVAAVQHLLGLGMAVTAYALLVRLGARRWVAALASTPVLLDAYQAQIEHNIMSDLLFQALLVAAFAVLVWPARPGWRVAAGAGLLLGTAVIVRQVGLPLVVPAAGYLLLAGGRPTADQPAGGPPAGDQPAGWRLAAGGWRRRALLAGTMVACFALPVAGYAGYYHHWTGHYGLSSVAGNTLYGRVATFADCTGLALPEYQRALCPTQPVAQRLGPDFWAHDETSPATAIRDAPPPGLDSDQALRDFSWRIIRHQPLDFARAVVGDALRAFSWQRTDGRDIGHPPVERWRFQNEYPTFPPLVTEESVAQISRRYGGDAPAVVSGLAHGLRWYQLHLGYTPGPALALAVLIALLACLRPLLARPWPGVARTIVRATPGDPAGSLRAACALYLTSGVLVLLVADVFEFSWRFQLPGYALLPVAGALGVTALTGRRPPAGTPRLPPPRSAQPGFPQPADEQAMAEFRQRYGEPSFPPVVVLIAAYNEAATLGPVLDAVPPACLGLPIATLVVVDGATDATVDVARAHGAYTCAVPVNRGQGAALRLGYHLARTGGCRYIVTTDADGQYEMAELPLLLEPLIAGEADFVTGSRRLGTNESTDRVRRAGTRFFAWLVSVLGGHRVTDTSFGFRGMRAEVPAQITLDQPQYQSAELLVGVLSRGFRVVERPMTMHARNGGKSKKGNNLVYGLRYARVVWSTWARERKTTRSSSRNLTRNITA